MQSFKFLLIFLLILQADAPGGPAVEGIQTDKQEDTDESTLDWWSRYFASKLALEKVSFKATSPSDDFQILYLH